MVKLQVEALKVIITYDLSKIERIIATEAKVSFVV